MRIWSKATREEVVEKYSQVGTVKETARLLKMGAKTASRHLRLAGINTDRRRRFPIHEVIEAVVLSKSLNEASMRLGGYSSILIEAYLDQYGLTISPNLAIYDSQGGQITLWNYKSSVHWPSDDQSD